MNSETNLLKQNYLDDEIYLKSILKFFSRNKGFIFGISSSITLLITLFSYTIKPTWRGGFQIFVNDNEQDNTSRIFDNNEILASLINGNKSNNKTQEFILRSPSVLMPVFQKVKKYNAEKGISNNNISYKLWVNNDLSIGFEKGTNILSISYINKDKDFIIDVLNTISSKYKNYSKLEKEKNISKSIIYLKEQTKIYEQKVSESQEKFNKFSIKNGLGDFDGFIKLKDDYDIPSVGNFENLILNNNNQNALKNNRSDAGQRYKNQFALLERYEAQYVNLSSKLKSNSKTLKNLKNKIENLKISLERPTEILLKYEVLKNKVIREENTLSSLKDNLENLKLMKAKQADPWQMISKPTIDNAKVSPNRKFIFTSSLLLSILFISLLNLLKEKKSGIIYSLDDLKRTLSCEFRDILNTKNKLLNNKLLKSFFKSQNLNSKINLIYLSSLNDSKYFDDLSEFIDLESNEYNLISIFDDEGLSKSENILLILKLGKLTYQEVLLINKYIKINKDKFIGWILLDSN